ncbi:hypothetical protein PQU92_02715 [Asticcacaulis sp. BYS171W]|uniref:Uncharacterized protein n=1 Tax=Asticcacaulis aquaticus TaxID=2984212 RepID=A0ABT5HQ26_9CAUL|nr:hypothetical protein [Asticcacaulis aquaticus]MDC7682170.1 hypothetical protein [Asticcacaulis aquaticus]
MLTFLGLTILVAGFFACHISPTHSYKLHRYEGQYLYLRCADLGIRCFAIAVFLAFVFYHIPSFTVGCFRIHLPIYIWTNALIFELFAKDQVEASRWGWLLTLTVLTFVSTFIYKFLSHVRLFLRFGTWDSRIFVTANILADSPLDSLLFNLSLAKDKYAMISMDDRKVYVGKVCSLGEPSETNGMDQDIAIIPLMSGYRDKDTLEVTFNTHYDEISAEILLTLRQSSIISATEFNFDAYKIWNPKPKKAKKTKAVADQPTATPRQRVQKAALGKA